MSGFGLYKQKLAQDGARHALRSWREPELADWTLRLGATTYSVHTAILGEGARSSPVLRASFKRWGQESRESDVGTMIPEACHVHFEAFLDFVYEDTEHFGGPELATAVPLFKMADMLEVRPLMKECISFLEGNLAAGSAPLVLGQALELELEGIVVEASAIMAKSFDSYRAEDLAPFSASALDGVLSDAGLCASSESVCRAVADFVRAGKLEDEDSFRLLARHVRSVHPSDALVLLAKVVAFKNDEALCNACKAAIAAHFTSLRLPDLCMVPDHGCVLDIFDACELNATEDTVFEAIETYLGPHEESGSVGRRFTAEEEEETWARCRFAFLSPDKWARAGDIDAIPPRWFKLGAARSRLSGDALHAFLADRSEVELRRFKPRLPWRSWVLTLDEPFDRNGVLYFLGTGCGTRAYTNPHTLGQVVASMSSKSTGDEHWICAHEIGQDVTNETQNVAGSWVAVDLGRRYRLRPTHYCLRSDSRKDEKLRHWIFQGSNDGEEWVTLSTCSNDESLDATPMSVAAFAVDAPEVPAEDVWVAASRPPGQRGAFRHFRVVQTGKNSSGSDYLDVAGLELYGLLTETQWDLLEHLGLKSETKRLKRSPVVMAGQRPAQLSPHGRPARPL